MHSSNCNESQHEALDATFDESLEQAAERLDRIVDLAGQVAGTAPRIAAGLVRYAAASAAGLVELVGEGEGA